jgi:hypothetical protein
MKTSKAVTLTQITIKIYVCLSLIMGMALTQLSAQNTLNKQGTGAVSYFYTCEVYDQPVYRDGVEIDYIIGSVTWHIVEYYKDGVFLWMNAHGSDVEIYSTYTDEVFKFSGSNNFDVTSNNVTRHFNLVGSNGSHYIGIMGWDDNGALWFDKMICPGK